MRNIKTGRDVKIDIIKVINKYLIHKQIERKDERLYLRMKKRKIISS